MSVLEEGCPQPLTRRHVSLLMPDNDLPCRSRGLPGDAGFSVAVVEASRENLQRCDCSRYRGKTTATLPPPRPPLFTSMQTEVLTATCKPRCMRLFQLRPLLSLCQVTAPYSNQPQWNWWGQRVLQGMATPLFGGPSPHHPQGCPSAVLSS